MATKESLKRVNKVVGVGDVILTYNKENVLSQFIANVTESDWSHCAMYVGNGNDCRIIYWWYANRTNV